MDNWEFIIINDQLHATLRVTQAISQDSIFLVYKNSNIQVLKLYS